MFLNMKIVKQQLFHVFLFWPIENFQNLYGYRVYFEFGSELFFNGSGSATLARTAGYMENNLS